MVKTKLVPPDGGWGWMIMSAYALNYLVAVPIMQCFGLLYKDTYEGLGFSATDMSLIMNTNAALSMFCGLINGPLINKFGCRKVAFVGAILITVGVLLTAYARTFTEFMITYGLITSLGIGMGLSAYPVALNTYFMKRRSIAAGYTMTISGFGPILLPQVISLMLSVYDVKGAAIILSGIAGQSFISALLLQPVKWHMKKEVVEDDADVTEFTIPAQENIEESGNSYTKQLTTSMLSLQEELEIESKYGIDTPLAGSLWSLSAGLPQRSLSISGRNNYSHLRTTEEDTVHETEGRSDNNRNEHANNIDNNGKINSNAPTITIEKEQAERKPLLNNIKKKKSVIVNGTEDQSNGKIKDVGVITENDPDLSIEKNKGQKKPLLKRIRKSIVAAFDLTLLKDPWFVNIVVGMSLAVFAELTFSLLTPFIMQDFGLNTQEIATFMSTLSIADICFRFLAPYVGDFFKKPARIMYMWALLLLIASRASLLMTTNNYMLLGCAAFLGVAKGFRTVYWTLVIPNYVPIERLASAIGIYSALNGIFIWLGGPLLGVIRDVTGSYKNCIIVTNCVSCTTVIMWSIELLYKRCKSRRKSDEEVVKA